MIDKLKQEKHLLFSKIARDWSQLQKDMDRLIEIELLEENDESRAKKTE